MAKLVNLRVISDSDGERERHELRIDWDNDRHQAVNLDSLEAFHIEAAFVRASIIINEERRINEI